MPAPGLLSTTTGWPRMLLALEASTRNAASVAPPGAKPTSSRIGRDGKAVWARAAGARASVAAAREPLRSWRRFMGASFSKNVRQAARGWSVASSEVPQAS